MSGITKRRIKRRKLFATANDKLDFDVEQQSNWDDFKNLSSKHDDIDSFSDSDDNATENASPNRNVTTRKAHQHRTEFVPLASPPIFPSSQTSILSFESDSSDNEIATNTDPIELNPDLNKVGVRPSVRTRHIGLTVNPEELSINIDFPTDTEVPEKGQLATDWLNNLKSPDPVTYEKTKDDSANKVSRKKHTPGSLAYKAERLQSYINGEHQLWLHKNFLSAHKPPYSEFCFFGRVVHHEVNACGVYCCKTVSMDSSHREVYVLHPRSMSRGSFKLGSVLCVFPSFDPFIRDSRYYILAQFHCHSLEEDEMPSLKDVAFVDHFLGVAADKAQTLSSPLQASASSNSSVKQNSGPPNTQVLLIHHIKILHNYGVEVLGEGPNRYLIVIEVDETTAHKFWTIISGSIGKRIKFNKVQLCYEQLAVRCLQWCSQLKLLQFKADTQLLLYKVSDNTQCVTMETDNVVNFQFAPQFRQPPVFGWYLGCILYNNAFLYYIHISYDTVKWIMSKNKIKAFLEIPRASYIKVSNLIGDTESSYLSDDVSLYQVVTSFGQHKKYPLLVYNQNAVTNAPGLEGLEFTGLNPNVTPQSLAILSIVIKAVSYDHDFIVTGVLPCKMLVQVIVKPDSVKGWLGNAERILEQDLHQLVNKRVSLTCLAVRNGWFQEVTI